MLYIIALVFGMWSNWPASGPVFRPLGCTLLFFVLIGLLGWKVFGAAVKG